MRTFEEFKKQKDITGKGISVFRIQRAQKYIEEEKRIEAEKQKEAEKHNQIEHNQEQKQIEQECLEEEASNTLKPEDDCSIFEEQLSHQLTVSSLDTVTEKLEADFEQLRKDFYIFLFETATKSDFSFITVHDCKETKKINELGDFENLKFLGEIPALDNYNLNAFCKKIYKILMKPDQNTKIYLLMLTNIKGTQDSCLSNFIMFLRKIKGRTIVLLMDKYEISEFFGKIPEGLVKLTEVKHFDCKVDFYEHYLGTWEKVLGDDLRKFDMGEIKGCIEPLEETLSYSTITNQMKLATLFFKNETNNGYSCNFRKILQRAEPEENLLNLTKPNIPRIIYKDIKKMNKLLGKFVPSKRMKSDDIDYIDEVKYVYDSFLLNYESAEEKVSLSQFFARIVEESEEEVDIKLVSKLIHEYSMHHLVKLEQDCQVVRKMLFN